MTESIQKFGLHNKLTARPGQRDALAQLLLDATRLPSGLPGCEVYVVSLDQKDANVVYVTEVWTTEQDHDVWQALPEVRAVIEQGRPLIATMPEQTRMGTIGGHGLR
jgi:quinol monooxygenase YgiN